MPIRYVHLDESLEYVVLELRLATPKDERTYLVLRSHRKEPGFSNLTRRDETMMRDADDLCGNGFQASVWQVSKQIMCEEVNAAGKPKQPRTKKGL
jgi:hypothetical protein